MLELIRRLDLFLVNLNADFDELVALGTDEQFQKLLTEVVNWMKAILADDWRAFVYVQDPVDAVS